MALAVALLPALVPGTAWADERGLDILWIECNDQSEPFSDEIRLQVNGHIVGSWNDVDGGERHWYYGSAPWANPIGIRINGETAINILEQDPGDLNLIGRVMVHSDEAGLGELTKPGQMYDGRYTIHYQVNF